MTTRSHINFLFYIKRTKLLNNGDAPIFVKIIAGNQNTELSILKSINNTLSIVFAIICFPYLAEQRTL